MAGNYRYAQEGAQEARENVLRKKALEVSGL
jgi:hypothetical protein